MLWTTRVLNLLIELVAVNRRTNENVRELLAVNRRILRLLRLRQPGLVSLRLVRESFVGETKMLHFVVVLPAPGAADVTERRLQVKVGDADPVDLVLAGDALESTEFMGADNAAVTGTLVDVDDAGNASPTRDFAMVLVDTLAPPLPGEVGMRVTSED